MAQKTPLLRSIRPSGLGGEIEIPARPEGGAHTTIQPWLVPWSWRQREQVGRTIACTGGSFREIPPLVVPGRDSGECRRRPRRRWRLAGRAASSTSRVSRELE